MKNRQKSKRLQKKNNTLPAIQRDSTVKLIMKEDGTSGIGSNALLAEDNFESLYYSTTNSEGRVIAPPFNLKVLASLVTENNSLAQCISAYEVNIDSTGYKIVPNLPESEIANQTEMDNLQSKAADFFKEPYPGESFITQRRLLRRDLESTGMAYLEVIENPLSEILFIKPLESVNIRLLRLSDPIDTRKSVIRGGVELGVTVKTRDRSYIQIVGDKKVYFKEFGVLRDINKTTGEWASKNQRLHSSIRGSSVIPFTVNKEVDGSYGLPRWINQIPSIIGSRKAEELNLDFFDSGGIPPVVAIVTGGAFAGEAKQDLLNALSGAAKSKLNAAVVEVHATGGTLDHPGKVDVKFEKFGAESKKDSMFEMYDEKSEKRIRSSFRLPPLFTGKTDDYSYATAFVSYKIAEAQVFRPERIEFDEIINITLMKALGFGDLKFVSLSSVITDTGIQLETLNYATSNGLISDEEAVEQINEIANLNIVYDEDAIIERREAMRILEGKIEIGGSLNPSVFSKSEHRENPIEIVELANNYAVFVLKIEGSNHRIDKEELELLKSNVSNLSNVDRALFNSIISAKTLSDQYHDIPGTDDLCGCAAQILAKPDKE